MGFLAAFHSLTDTSELPSGWTSPLLLPLPAHLFPLHWLDFRSDSEMTDTGEAYQACPEGGDPAIPLPRTSFHYLSSSSTFCGTPVGTQVLESLHSDAKTAGPLNNEPEPWVTLGTNLPGPTVSGTSVH
ncbi:hypothetical protein MG293_010295 [Ovis ammon polii]|uniref:Uncharacterized protein n=1 Tax=Ovis ammon polii TaxID=230172 RepID=A0AAD4UAA0_OVIAM|nr:hypothetical protein MG293_010295 [Ovis ammon polii]